MNNKKFWAGVLVVVCLWVFASRAQGAIETVDSEFGVLVRDTEARKEWLKPGKTRGRSLDDIRSQLGTGGEFEGFDHASSSELSVLFRHLGLDPNGAVPGHSAAADAIGLLGGTGVPNGGTAGIYGSGSIATISIRYVPSPISSVTTIGGQSIGSSETSSFLGHWLQRPMESSRDIGESSREVGNFGSPEPASILVWTGLGFVAVMVANRRRRRSSTLACAD